MAVTHSFRKFWTALQKTFVLTTDCADITDWAAHIRARQSPVRRISFSQVACSVRCRWDRPTKHTDETKRRPASEIFGSFRVFRGQKKRRGSAAPQNTCVIRVIRGGLSEDNNKWPLLLLWGKGINDFFGSGSLGNVRPITGAASIRHLETAVLHGCLSLQSS